jgi:DNA-binding PadR family transcriptional regulator
VNLLAHDGLLTAEERDERNEPRRMVAITAAGRRALEDGDRSA